MKKGLIILITAIILCVAAVLSCLFLFSPDNTEKEGETEAGSEGSTNPDTATETDPTKPKYSEGLEYDLNEEEQVYYVTGIGVCTDTDVNIPPEYNGLPVARIQGDAFNHCDQLKSVTIPGSVIRICDQAFYQCPSLESVYISEGVEYLESDVFRGCKKLTSITIPSSLVTIPTGGLLTNTSFMETAVPINLYYLGTLEDWGKLSLTYSVFYGNLYFEGELVEELEIPKEIAENGKYLFSQCLSVKKVTFENSTERIAEGMFSGCASLETVILPDSLKEIDYEAFRSCGSLTQITIPASLEKIGVNVFSHCALTSIKLPSTLKEIGAGAFEYCPLTEIVIPEGVTTLKATFQGCEKLTSVTLPSSLTTIDDYTFSLCKALKSISIPKSVIKIGTCAFQYCDSLDDIYYVGDYENWGKIEKADNWLAIGTSKKIILHCSDIDYPLH